MHQVVRRPGRFGGHAKHLAGLLAPVSFEHRWQAPHQHIEKTADDKAEYRRHGDKGPGLLSQQQVQNAVPSWNTGRYMAITSDPTMPPSTTMINGSIKLVRLSTWLSTSDS